jgi:hypothetical protein
MERLSKVDLLVGTSLDQLLLDIVKHCFLFKKTTYLIEEVNSTELFPSVSIPCMVPTVRVKKLSELALAEHHLADCQLTYCQLT